MKAAYIESAGKLGEVTNLGVNPGTLSSAPLVVTAMAEPHRTSRAELSRPLPPGPSSRWMMEGRLGVTLDRKGNSSTTTRVGRPRNLRNSSAIASFQSRKGRSITSRVCRTSASAKSRSDSASVASVAAKYMPPVSSANACRRKLFPCLRRPLTIPSAAPFIALADAKEASPCHSRTRSNTRSGFGTTRVSMTEV